MTAKPDERPVAKDLEFCLVGPFDSEARLEFLDLAGVAARPRELAGTPRKEALLRLAIPQLINDSADDRVILERFIRRTRRRGGDDLEQFDDVSEARQRAWLEQGDAVPETLVFDEDGGPAPGRGAIVRVESPWSMELTCPEHDPAGSDGERFRSCFAELRAFGCEKTLLDRLTIDLYRHGIGVFSLRARVRVAAPAHELNALCECLVGATVLHPGLVDEIQRLDRRLGRAIRHALSALGRASGDDGPVFEPEHGRDVLHGRPRWGNCVLLSGDGLPADGSPPLGSMTWQFLQNPRASSAGWTPSSNDGFSQIGWGRSIMVEARDRRRRLALDAIRRLQADWRTVEALGRDLRGRLAGLTGLQHAPWREVRDGHRVIQRIKLECELLEANHDRFLTTLHPFTYAVYRQGQESWRMADMVSGYKRVLDTLELLSDGWIQRKEARDAKRLNLLVLSITAFTLVSVLTDVTDFIAKDDLDSSVPLAWRITSVIVAIAAPFVMAAVILLWNEGRKGKGLAQ